MSEERVTVQDSQTSTIRIADPVRYLEDIKPGMVFGGKYKLEEQLGAGNFGVVFKAMHLGSDLPVAVKIMNTRPEPSPQDLERFRREGQLALLLGHPNAVTVTDCSITPGGLPYLVMDLLVGRSLKDELQEPLPMSHHRAASIVLSICGALEKAHQLGILHRDIKPANIFLHQVAGREVVKVLDFGLAKLMDETSMAQNLTLDGELVGSPAYMAPERFMDKPCDGRSDAYSLGVMLYEMLAGQRPFVSDGKGPLAMATMHLSDNPAPLRQHCLNLAPELENAAMALLKKDPEQRLEIRMLARCLESYLGRGSSTSPTRASSGDPQSKFLKTPPRLTGARMATIGL